MTQKYSTPVYKREVPSWAYDALIAVGLFASVAGLFWVPWLFWIPVVVLIWGSFIEPRLLTVRRYAIGDGKRTLRIAFLSDIHVGPYKGAAWMDRLVRKTNALKPDLVLLGGDFVYDASSDPSSLSRLSGLKSKYGTVGIMGNHDFSYQPDKTEGILNASSVTLLRNAARRFLADGTSFAVVGVEDDWDADTDFAKAFAATEAGDTVICLIHNPDLAPHAAKHTPTLMLSGHVHGGQIRLPLLGPVPRLPHHLGRRYDRGLFMFGRVPLIIGQGVGESGPRARLFCPPQILEISLRH